MATKGDDLASIWVDAAGVANARRLLELYLEEKKQSTFKRSLEECIEHERKKIGLLRDAYVAHLDAAGVRFLNADYFKKYKRFVRCQEIPEQYFSRECTNYSFVSHRWLNTTEPDPRGDQYSFVYEQLAIMKPAQRASHGIWYDYSCVPQRDENGKRSMADDVRFKSMLNVMHLLPLFSSNISLFDSGYLHRAWCMTEMMCATETSSVPMQKMHIPLINRIGFRFMAMLVLFLMKDNTFKAKFMSGDDGSAITHLTALTRRCVESRESTVGTDKPLLVSMIYEHCQNHWRVTGFRTLLMMAFLILERLEEKEIELLFAQFLFVTKDPHMTWTVETAFVLESLFNGMGNPTDMVFHRGEVVVRSKSEMQGGSKPKSR